MSETPKRSLFGRMFGGSKTEAPPEEAEQARAPREPVPALPEEVREEAARTLRRSACLAEY